MPTSKSSSSTIALPKSTTAETDSKPKFQIRPTTYTLDTIPPNSYLVHATNCFSTWGAGVALAIHDLFPNADEVYSTYCDSFRPSSSEWPKKGGLVGGVCIVPPQAGDHATKKIRSEGDDDQKNKGEGRDIDRAGDDIEGVWIGCLFTSYGYGRPTKRKAALDKKSLIWAQTKSSLRKFRELIEKIESGEAKVIEQDGMKVLQVGEQSSRGKKRKRDAEDDDEEVEADGERDASHETSENNERDSNENDDSKGIKMDIYSPQFNSGAFGIKWGDTKKLVEEIFAGWEGYWYVLNPPG